MSAVVFKCQDCGNLHGARVEACGMCGSSKVALDPPETPAPAPASAAPIGGIPESLLDELVTSIIDLCDSAAAWFRYNTPDPEDDAEPTPNVSGG